MIDIKLDLHVKKYVFFSLNRTFFTYTLLALPYATKCFNSLYQFQFFHLKNQVLNGITYFHSLSYILFSHSFQAKHTGAEHTAPPLKQSFENIGQHLFYNLNENKVGTPIGNIYIDLEFIWVEESNQVLIIITG